MTTHGYTGSNSPNRADAFVWLMSELFPGMTKEKLAGKDLISMAAFFRFLSHSYKGMGS